jgi:hypothetical protein
MSRLRQSAKGEKKMADQLYNIIDATLTPKEKQPMQLSISEIGIANFNLQSGKAGNRTNIGMLIGVIKLSESNFYIKWKPTDNQKAVFAGLKSNTALKLGITFALKPLGNDKNPVFSDFLKIPEVKLKSVANSDGFEKIEIISDAKERKNMEVTE